MRKILFGALLGGALVYFFDPDRGAERRARLSSRWGEQRDSVLDLARSAGGAAGTIGHGVTELVDKAQKTEANGVGVETSAVHN